MEAQITKIGCCKVVIYNYIYVGFNSMSNLIVFYSIFALYVCGI